MPIADPKDPPMLHPINPRQHTVTARELRRAVDGEHEGQRRRRSTLDEMYRRIDEDLEQL
ncbi:hypothetical protein [Amnibacterium kyonggiense]|uniref:hypothetical protein n=1 Tax=Amnibacterium kyonggiense TaxID=595671 RepID=UPI00105DAF49|nr:hypothetical protein [Amnibacterium kyonggiense]